MVSTISKYGFAVSLAGYGLDYILETSQSQALQPIAQHIGDWKYISLCAGVLPAILARELIDMSERHGKEKLVRVGQYIPKTTVALATMYFTLGESVLPSILPGTADPLDIPAVLLAGISTYFGVDVITKSERNN